MAGGRWTATYPGGGVRISLDEERVRQEIQVSLSTLRAAVGDRIVANLCKCLAGCDRLTSLAHLSILNAALPEDSVARFRNIQTIALLMFGLIHELAMALARLRGAGIERALSDPEPWHRVDAVRVRWAQQTANRMRNSVAFHLSERLDETGALDKLQAFSDTRILHEVEGAKLLNARHPVGEELLLIAVDVEFEEMQAVGLQAPVDSRQVTMDLFLIAKDLLRRAGARLG